MGESVKKSKFLDISASCSDSDSDILEDNYSDLEDFIDDEEFFTTRQEVATESINSPPVARNSVSNFFKCLLVATFFMVTSYQNFLATVSL